MKSCCFVELTGAVTRLLLWGLNLYDGILSSMSACYVIMSVANHNAFDSLSTGFQINKSLVLAVATKI